MSQTKLCPYCGEQIQVIAIKCKHCGERLDGGVTPISSPGPGHTGQPAIGEVPTGTRVGAFILGEVIGTGGMGSVYAGEHERLGQPVAVKVLAPNLARDPELMLRFEQEARLQANLRHPNIVAVQDFLGEAGTYAFVMERVDGRTLEEMIQQETGPIPFPRCMQIFLPVLSALSYAHQQGVVHRDIKPSNIMIAQVGTEEVVKVADFGIAKALGAAHRTATGTKMGTLHYMSPEQCRGAGDIDLRADIYSLGATLYEMATGQVPFDRDSEFQLMKAHIEEAPTPPSELYPGVFPAFELVIARAMAKNRDDRFENADELKAALEAIREEVEGHSAPVSRALSAAKPSPARFPTTTTTPTVGDAPRVKRPIWPYIAGVVVVLGLTVMAVGLLMSGADEAETGGTRSPTASAALEPVPAPVPTAHEPTPTEEEPTNRWVRIEPPDGGARLVLGVRSNDAPSAIPGFRPSRRVRAPSHPYVIQQHEVTWGELRPWLAQHAEHQVALPGGLSEADAASLPASGMSWAAAMAFCKSVGGALPTEEEWEYAARGADLRPHPWGAQPLDGFRTHAYRQGSKQLSPVMTNEQDATPGGDGGRIFDLAGNAREWTADIYRLDVPGEDESWTQSGGVTYRAVRGLPPFAESPASLPRETAAFREALCATGPCPPDAADLLRHIGFRCSKRVGSGLGSLPPADSGGRLLATASQTASKRVRHDKSSPDCLRQDEVLANANKLKVWFDRIKTQYTPEHPDYQNDRDRWAQADSRYRKISGYCRE